MTPPTAPTTTWRAIVHWDGRLDTDIAFGDDSPLADVSANYDAAARRWSTHVGFVGAEPSSITELADLVECHVAHVKQSTVDSAPSEIRVFRDGNLVGADRSQQSTSKEVSA